MNPSKIKEGQKLKIQTNAGGERTAYFIERIAGTNGTMSKAINFVRFPDFAKLDGPDDDGIVQMSDKALSERGQYA